MTYSFDARKAVTAVHVTASAVTGKADSPGLQPDIVFEDQDSVRVHIRHEGSKLAEFVSARQERSTKGSNENKTVIREQQRKQQRFFVMRKKTMYGNRARRQDNLGEETKRFRYLCYATACDVASHRPFMVNVSNTTRQTKLSKTHESTSGHAQTLWARPKRTTTAKKPSSTETESRHGGFGGANIVMDTTTRCARQL